jgi:hypothetical protein
MGPSSDSERLLKGLYQYLFIECNIIGIDLDSSEWRLYPTLRSRSNAYYDAIYAMACVRIAKPAVGTRLRWPNLRSLQKMV